MKSPTVAQQPTILIIDDNPANIRLLEKLLINFGYSSIHSISDPREASRIYSEIHPDLVLLDLNMPYMDGFQVMKQLKELEGESHAPILIMTAQNDKETKLKALKEGAVDFLSKPFYLAEAMRRIQNILEVRLLQNLVREQDQILD